MSLVITGTPGVGKHTISKKLSKVLDYEILDINKIALESNLYEKTSETNDIDVLKLKNILKKKISKKAIIVGHLAPYVLTKSQVSNACFSLQETAFAMITEVVERALAFTKKKELLIVGGVAANKRLSEMFQSVCKRHNCKFFVSPRNYSGDCGSQIAWTGLLESSVKDGTNIDKTFVRQSWRLDTVDIDY